MEWNINLSLPIYPQLMDRIESQIISGYYEPGGRLPAVRELAVDANVNPNTMQKALLELERTGIVISERTKGRFITTDTALISSLREKKAKAEILAFEQQMKQLQYSFDDIVELWKNMKGEEANV